MNLKHNGLTIALLFLAINMFSQIKKGDCLISFDGNYLNSSSSKGTYTDQNYTEGKYLNSAISAGIFVSKQLVIGVDIDYYHAKEIQSTYQYFDKFIQIENLNTTSSALTPGLFTGYYQRLFRNLYFSGLLRCNYGKIISEYKFKLAGEPDPYLSSESLAETDDSYAKEGWGKSKTDYFRAELCPEFTYFIASGFGVSIGLGGLKYSLTEWKTDNSAWIVNLNPDHWKLGLKIRI